MLLRLARLVAYLRGPVWTWRPALCLLLGHRWQQVERGRRYALARCTRCRTSGFYRLPRPLPRHHSGR